ncbi:hypothetical protein ACFWIA_24585 [Streptomyces sp. NPDC127068]|uniref:hypothetical protein n=1 Tax=Streptomyces sp. NPDC127068 TaxID=3347127 RepID=UPI003667B931
MTRPGGRTTRTAARSGRVRLPVGVGAALLAAALLAGCSAGGGASGGGASDRGSATSGEAASASGPPPTAPRASVSTAAPPPAASAAPTTAAPAAPTAPTGDTVAPPSPPPATPSTPSGPTGAAALWGREYRGTAKVSVDVYDHCGAGGARRLADSRTYSLPGTLSLSRPRTGGGFTEDNPFSLVLAVGQPSDTGALSMWSAAVSTTSGQDLTGNPRDPNLLLTYWDLDWSAGQLSGRLTDPHTREAVALNLVNWPTPLAACRPELGQLPGGHPHALGAGTTLGGRLDTGGLSLTAQGSTQSGNLTFRFAFTGGS